MPERIQLSRAKGWRMPPNTVSVARPGRWSNQYHVDIFGRPLAVELFRNSVEGYWSPSKVEHLSDELARAAYRCHTQMRARLHHANVLELRGKNLACWCHLCAEHRAGRALGIVCPHCDPCHADVLLELANR
jgi:hypothetical protein